MKVRISATVDETIVEAVTKEAERENRSVSNFIETALANKLGMEVPA